MIFIDNVIDWSLRKGQSKIDKKIKAIEDELKKAEIAKKIESNKQSTWDLKKHLKGLK